MSENDHENTDLPVAEAGKDPRPPDSSSLKNESDGSHTKPPKGESPKEGKMKSVKEYSGDFGKWIEKNKELLILALALIGFLVWNPLGFSNQDLISTGVIGGIILFAIMNPLKLEKFFTFSVSIIAIAAVVFFTWNPLGWGNIVNLDQVSFSPADKSDINALRFAVSKIGKASRSNIEALRVEAAKDGVVTEAEELFISKYTDKILNNHADIINNEISSAMLAIAAEAENNRARDDRQDDNLKTIVKNEEKMSAAINQVAGETVVVTPSSSDSSSAPTITRSTANGVTNTLTVDLYAFIYGDWDGKKIIKIAPGETLKAGFSFGDGKSIQSGVHLNFFALYNNGKTWTLDEVIADPSRATYYWAEGLVPITGKTHYNKAFTVVDGNGAFLDGYKVTERMGGSNVAVAVDTFQAGRIPTRTMRF